MSKRSYFKVVTLRNDSLLHWLAAVLHQQSDGSRRRVELGHVIFVHNLPHAADIWVRRQALKLEHEQTARTITSQAHLQSQY